MLGGNADIFQQGFEPHRLRALRRVIGDSEDKERRDTLALRDMRDGVFQYLV